MLGCCGDKLERSKGKGRKRREEQHKRGRGEPKGSGLGRTMGLKQIGDKKRVSVVPLYSPSTTFDFFPWDGKPSESENGWLRLRDHIKKNCCHQPDLTKESRPQHGTNAVSGSAQVDYVVFEKYSVLLRSSLRYLAVSNVTDIKAQSHKEKKKRSILRGKSSYCFARNN